MGLGSKGIGTPSPQFLSVWDNGSDVSEALIAEIVRLLSTARRVLLIYEEVECRPHHSETPITCQMHLASIVRRMVSENAFIVLSDLETFALVPIALNELVIIHDGSVAFAATGTVHSKDSTRTYECTDWFEFIGPEVAIIMAT